MIHVYFKLKQVYNNIQSVLYNIQKTYMHQENQQISKDETNVPLFFLTIRFRVH